MNWLRNIIEKGKPKETETRVLGSLSCFPPDYHLHIVAAGEGGSLTAGNHEKRLVMNITFYEARLSAATPEKMTAFLKRNHIKPKYLLADGTLPISNSPAEGLAMAVWPYEIAEALKTKGVLVGPASIEELIAGDTPKVHVTEEPVSRFR